mmetsp:Transcript_24838/g.67659  ORF Transcript_24838/g.67659 Transcript_24838/m.67659 type:complete len:154 (+) Transcript_24838:301-762(+)
MAKKSETTTPVVTRKLALFLVLFYIIYYVLSIILVGAFGVEWTRLGGFPFRTAMSEFNPEAGGGALGAWLAMVITYVLSLLLAYYVVRATKRTWDYMITTSFIHWVICCLVNQQFPVNWIWWVTLIIATILVSVAAEFAIYFLRDLKEIELDH